MKSFLILFFVTAQLFFYGQKKQLVIENRIDHKQIFIKEGAWIKATFNNKTNYRGVMHVVNDSVISVGLGRFPLKQVTCIETDKFGANMFRALVITTGIVTYVFIAATVVFSLAVLILVNSYGGVMEYDGPPVFYKEGGVNDGLKSLYEVADYMEKSYPSEKYTFAIDKSVPVIKE